MGRRADDGKRREWFERMDDMAVVLWWVPSGHRPSTTEAIERLGQRTVVNFTATDLLRIGQPGAAVAGNGGPARRLTAAPSPRDTARVA